jgi:hypothetical protein
LGHSRPGWRYYRHKVCSDIPEKDIEQRMNFQEQIMTCTFYRMACLVAVAFVAANLTSTAQQKVPAPANDELDPKMSIFLDCAKLCDDCKRACDLSSSQCIQLIANGNKDFLPALRACQDCATICSATSRIVMVNGPCTDVICASCIEACKRCATLCEKSSDPILKRSAQACMICEKACRDLPKQTQELSK